MIPTLWAYFGPETTLPLMSILAVILGFLLTCWNYTFRTLKWIVTAPFRSANSGPIVSPEPTTPTAITTADAPETANSVTP